MRRWVVIAAVAAMLPIMAGAGDEGTMPPPVFKVKVTARASVESGGFRYIYDVENKPGSTLSLSGVRINVGTAYDATNAEAPAGWSLLDFPARFCQSCPSRHSIWFLPASNVLHPERETPFPSPGAQVSGFTLISHHPPGIVQMTGTSWVEPWFDAYFKKFGYDPDEGYQDEIRRNATAHVPVLGPMDAAAGTFAHWDRYLADVAKAVGLSWIPDASLARQVQDVLSQARHAAGRGDSAKVTTLLDQVIALVQGAGADRITGEGKELVLLNAQYLKSAQPAPYEPVLDLSPATSAHDVGEEASVTAHYYNRADGLPLPGDGSATIHFEVTDGPDAGMSADIDTDPTTGKATWSYRGLKLGTDHVQAEVSPGYAPRKSAPASGPPGSKTVTVRWIGGPDLRIRVLIPPLTIANPGDQVAIVEESTVNTGNIPAGPSVTRYYVTPDPSLDPKTFVELGEREVPGLDPGESSDASSLSFILPGTGTGSRGKYYLVACADAANQVVETDETNNCSTSNILGSDSVGIVVKKGGGIVPGSGSGIGTLTLLGILGMILLVAAIAFVIMKHA